ncbi:MAG: hypothetical protein WCP79_10925 [Bacillota bacterium]
MNIAYITQKLNHTLFSALTGALGEVTVFNSLDDFSATQQTPSALIISTGFGCEQLQPFINSTRRSGRLCLTPIILETNGAFSTYYKPLQLGEIQANVQEIAGLASELEVHNYNSWENRILAYFYTRPDFQIRPKLDKTKPMFYYYPLVEQFYEGAADYFFWLEEMVSQNILSKTKLIDRLFCCPACFSALLKFSDHCPNCGSINIRNEKFIHCFTCGHVAPESAFLKDAQLARLVCPSCGTKLKLFGEDYDRPLENGVCQDCGVYHIESKLRVDCMSCGKTFSTDDLSKRPIYEYKLTDYGRNQVKFGTVNAVGLIVNELNYMMIGNFSFMLDWMIAMQLRYKSECFGLVSLEIIPGNSGSGYDLLLEFAQFLRTVVRTTDMCTKLDYNTFVFLLPKTDSAGLSIITGRIAEFNKSLELKQGHFDSKMNWFSSETEDITDASASLLLEKVSAKL